MIKILSTHNLLCRILAELCLKFATFCFAYFLSKRRCSLCHLKYVKHCLKWYKPVLSTRLLTPAVLQLIQTDAAGVTDCSRDVRDAIAVLDVRQGARCDEINERSYCSHGLVCHKCPADLSGYKCVRCEWAPSLIIIISSRLFIVQVT